jgi:hypothetical protein
MQIGSSVAEVQMENLFWIALGIVGWAIGLVGLFALMRMAGDEDRAARQQEELLYPVSDVPVTQAGVGRFVRIECATGRDRDAAGARVVWRLEWPGTRQAAPADGTRVAVTRSGNPPRIRQAEGLHREGARQAEQAWEAVTTP